MEPRVAEWLRHSGWVDGIYLCGFSRLEVHYLIGITGWQRISPAVVAQPRRYMEA